MCARVRYKVKDREDVQSEMMALALQYYPPSEVLGASELFYEGVVCERGSEGERRGGGGTGGGKDGGWVSRWVGE